MRGSMFALVQAPTHPQPPVRRLVIGVGFVAVYTLGIAFGLMAIGYRVGNEVVEAAVIEASIGETIATARLQARLDHPVCLAPGQSTMVVLDGEPVTGAVLKKTAETIEVSVIYQGTERPRKAEVHVPAPGGFLGPWLSLGGQQRCGIVSSGNQALDTKVAAIR